MSVVSVVGAWLTVHRECVSLHRRRLCSSRARSTYGSGCARDWRRCLLRRVLRALAHAPAARPVRQLGALETTTVQAHRDAGGEGARMVWRRSSRSCVAWRRGNTAPSLVATLRVAFRRGLAAARSHLRAGSRPRRRAQMITTYLRGPQIRPDDPGSAAGRLCIGSGSTWHRPTRSTAQVDLLPTPDRPRIGLGSTHAASASNTNPPGIGPRSTTDRSRLDTGSGPERSRIDPGWTPRPIPD